MNFEAAVKDIILRMQDVKSFRFPRPQGFEYKPGQFMFVTVKSGNEELKKHFTISSSPTERDYIEFTKKLTGHPFSNALNALKVGDRVKLDAAYGKFTFNGEYEKIGMLTGGIGITPLRSIIKYCTDMKLENKIILLYSNHTDKDIVFREELEEMQAQNRNLKVVFTVSEPGEDWTGLRGRIDAGMVKREIPDYMERVFYTVGTAALVETMDKLLKDLGVPESQIKKENFQGY